jgi:hypothetical protein
LSIRDNFWPLIDPHAVGTSRHVTHRDGDHARLRRIIFGGVGRWSLVLTGKAAQADLARRSRCPKEKAGSHDNL